MNVFRSPANPIITPKDITPTRDDFEVIGAFNAGAARLGDQTILLLRIAERPINKNPDLELTALYDCQADQVITKQFSKSDTSIDYSDPRLIITPDDTYLTSISHLRIARSTDGINFQIDPSPALEAANPYETLGIEDPRITKIDDTYYITYVAASAFGITTCLASTTDFLSFSRHGIIFCPDNKDVVLFPERIDGRYYALHRPVSGFVGKHEIWIAESPDLKCWGDHRYLMGLSPGRWDETKIGAGAPPFKTPHGWLELYHGADRNNRYCMGAVLLDIDQPWKVIARTAEPVLTPQTDYETEGFFGNVVFSCGLLYEQEKIKIYYGVADTSIALAEIDINDILKTLGL